MQKLASVLAGLLLVIAPTAVFAQTSTVTPSESVQTPPNYQRHGHRGMKHGRIFDQLNLNASQKSQIQQIMETGRAQNAPLMDQFRTLRTQMREARTANDTARIESLKEQMVALRPQLEQARTQTMQQVEAVLTPEQRTQLEQLKQQKQERMTERRSLSTPKPL